MLYVHFTNIINFLRIFYECEYFMKIYEIIFFFGKNNIKTIECKIPFREEIIPLIKNIHISNNYCDYKILCNQIILNKYYWKGYTNYIQEYLNECELCNAKKKLIK